MLRSFLAMFLISTTFFPLKASAEVDWVYEYTGEFTYSPSRNNIPNFFFGFEIARKLHAYFRFNVDPDTGVGWTNVTVTNNYGHRGYTTCFDIVFTGDGASLTASYELGLNPDEDRVVQRDISMTPEAWAMISTVRVRGGWCPSGKLGNAVVGSFVDAFEGIEDLFDGSPPTPVGTSTETVRETYTIWWQTARIPCARPNGTSGMIEILRESELSCEDAHRIVQSEAESGQACSYFVGGDAVLSGLINYGQGCGEGWKYRDGE